jgi:hypothetical protein
LRTLTSGQREPGCKLGKELGALDGALAGLTTVVLVLLLGQTRVG